MGDKLYYYAARPLQENSVVRINAKADKTLRLLQRQTGLSLLQLASELILYAADHVELIEAPTPKLPPRREEKPGFCAYLAPDGLCRIAPDKEEEEATE